MMNSEGLPPVLLSANKRYSLSIPQGRLTPSSGSEIPIISRKGEARPNPLSMRDVMTDPNFIDMKLKSLSNMKQSESRVSLQTERKQKAGLKFLKYKFNPGTQGDGENIEKDIQLEIYGQLGAGTREKVNINTFYQHKNVLFQDERAPLVYKRLFLQREQHE